MSQPVVAVTMGDPAGISPEIVARAFAEPEVRKACRPVVVGDPRIMFRAMELVRGGLVVRTVPSAREAGGDPGTLDVLPDSELPPGTLKPGTLDARWGEVAAACCRKAVELAKAGEVAGITSAPFNKEAFHMAGEKFEDRFKIYEDVQKLVYDDAILLKLYDHYAWQGYSAKLNGYTPFVMVRLWNVWREK